MGQGAGRKCCAKHALHPVLVAVGAGLHSRWWDSAGFILCDKCDNEGAKKKSSAGISAAAIRMCLQEAQDA